MAYRFNNYWTKYVAYCSMRAERFSTASHYAFPKTCSLIPSVIRASECRSCFRTTAGVAQSAVSGFALAKIKTLSCAPGPSQRKRITLDSLKGCRVGALGSQKANSGLDWPKSAGLRQPERGAGHDQHEIPGCDVAENWSGRAGSRCFPDAPLPFDRRRFVQQAGDVRQGCRPDFSGKVSGVSPSRNRGANVSSDI